jgi:hypothetical protein
MLFIIYKQLKFLHFPVFPLFQQAAAPGLWYHLIIVRTIAAAIATTIATLQQVFFGKDYQP